MRIETTESWFGSATLDSLIAALEKCPRKSQVEFSFCGLVPNGWHSYRGYYEFMALGWANTYPGPTVEQLLKTLKSAIGKEMSGWKGGQYNVDAAKPLFIANPGETDGTGIIAVETDEEPNGYTILVTAKVD